jgi:hypothetical protein
VGAVIFALTMNLGGDDPNPGTQPSTNPSTTPPTSGTVAIRDLVMAAPQELEFVTMENTVQFAGSADPRKEVTIGGEKVTVNADGTFIHTLTLQNGVNEIPLTYLGETVTLESPVMFPDGSHDIRKLNQTLDYLRQKTKNL